MNPPRALSRQQIKMKNPMTMSAVLVDTSVVVCGSGDVVVGLHGVETPGFGVVVVVVVLGDGSSLINTTSGRISDFTKRTMNAWKS